MVSDLHSVTPANFLSKYADATYLIIPATNVKSCSAEISNNDTWACNNNLRLNPSMSLEIIFVNPWMSKRRYHRRFQVSLQVEEIKMLCLTFTQKFSMSCHVNDLSRCSQSLFALRTLWQQGLPADAPQVVFQAIVINKLSYASPAWWGFASADDQNHLEAFLWQSTKFGYRGNSTSTFTSLCDEVDEQLFDRVAYNTHHLLHPLLSPRHNRHYSFRQRTHDFELPDHTSELKNKNFLMRMLFKQRGCSTSLCISQS